MGIYFDLPKIDAVEEYYIHMGGRYNGKTIYYIKDIM